MKEKDVTPDLICKRIFLDPHIAKRVSNFAKSRKMRLETAFIFLIEKGATTRLKKIDR